MVVGQKKAKLKKNKMKSRGKEKKNNIYDKRNAFRFFRFN